MKILGILLALTIATPAAAAPVHITEDRGGILSIYGNLGDLYVKTNTQVVIDGICASSCVTMADNANAVTCITPHAVFYIHKMRDTVTNRNFQIYYRTPGLNEWIAAQGGEPDQDNRGLQGMLRMTYKDAKNFWKTCQN